MPCGQRKAVAWLNIQPLFPVKDDMEKKRTGMRYGSFALVLAGWLLSTVAGGQELALTLEEAASLMRRNNRTLQMADRAVDAARAERQGMNAYWYPSLNAQGAWVHLSGKVEVQTSLRQLTGASSFLPNDGTLASLADAIGAQTLTVPLLGRRLSAVDATLTWPLFVGGKRMEAARIGRRLVDLALLSREETDAALQTELVTAYYASRLAERVVAVRRQAFEGLQQHYLNALKLEGTGMINKAERLFAQVSRDEAACELDAARKSLHVARQTLKAVLGVDDTAAVRPVSPLFINADLPEVFYFKGLIPTSSYVVGKLRIEEIMAGHRLRMSRSAYLPTVALLGKQTLWAEHLPKNLMPRTLIGVGFTWNLFDGLSRESEVRRARLARQSVRLGREKAQEDLGVLVDRLYGDLKNAQADAATLRTTLEMSSELVRIRRKSFGEGMATSTDVVDAETMLARVQVAFLTACYEYDVALASLLAACGIPDSFRVYSRSGQAEAGCI